MVTSCHELHSTVLPRTSRIWYIGILTALFSPSGFWTSRYSPGLLMGFGIPSSCQGSVCLWRNGHWGTDKPQLRSTHSLHRIYVFLVYHETWLGGVIASPWLSFRAPNRSFHHRIIGRITTTLARVPIGMGVQLDQGGQANRHYRRVVSQFISLHERIKRHGLEGQQAACRIRDWKGTYSVTYAWINRDKSLVWAR